MKKRIIGVSAVALSAAAALLYLYFSEEERGAGIPCTFLWLTGFYCPGCGSSRALRQILHLDFYGALRYNALFTIASPFLAVYFGAAAIRYIKNGGAAVKKIPLWPLAIVGAIFLCFGILRNLPAFSFLAPTAV